MKRTQIVTLAFSLLSTSILTLAQNGLPETPAPPAEPGPPGPVITAPDLKSDDLEVDEDRPRGPSKRIRIERRGPGNTVQIEERDVTVETDVVAEIEVDSEDGRKVERRIIRRPGGGGGDLIVRRFDGPPGGLEVHEGHGDRADHVNQAIHHLHAAGMHDLADRVQARMKHGGGQPAPEMQKQMDDLKRDNAKLRKKLRKLKQAPAPAAAAKETAPEKEAEEPKVKEPQAN